jgi:hypothetical protein
VSSASREKGSSRSFRDAVELVALVVAPATLLGALLYYFGWSRSNAQAEYFGINADILGRSSHEYVLRSIDSIFWPLVLLLLAVLLAIAFHAVTKQLVHAKRRGVVLLLAASAVLGGAALIVLGVLGVVWRPRVGESAVFTPVAFALGIPLFGYGGFLLSVALAKHRDAPPGLPHAAVWLFAGFSAIFVFWAIGNFAHLRGQQLAARAAVDLHALPSVVVFSANRLYLDGLGVEEAQLPGSDGAFRFKYTGLRFLSRGGAKTFLLPEGWCRTDVNADCERKGVVFVLQDTDELRLDFSPGPGPHSRMPAVPPSAARAVQPCAAAGRHDPPVLGEQALPEARGVEPRSPHRHGDPPRLGERHA